VLAIDDELHVGTALKRSLESAFPRIQVDVVTDPAAAMAASGAAADIALVDMNMPGHNGLEVCMHLLAMPPSGRPAVVAMSAAANDENVAVLQALGVRDFVRKDESFPSAMNRIIARFRASTAPSSRPPRSRPKA
jgi:CheY-like chemotaxis protein